MQPTSTIILSTIFGHNSIQEACSDLDQMIFWLANKKINPILVLGPQGDEILSYCQRSIECDLAYDPNFSGRPFSSIKAGVTAAQSSCLVVPIIKASELSRIFSELRTPLFYDFCKNKAEAIELNMTSSLYRDVLPTFIFSSTLKKWRDLPAATEWKNGETIQIMRYTPAYNLQHDHTLPTK